MATVISDPPTPSVVTSRVAPTSAPLGGGGATTTYCYRTSLGVRGTTTDPDAIPAGAEVERTVTS